MNAKEIVESVSQDAPTHVLDALDDFYVYQDEVSANNANHVAYGYLPIEASIALRDFCK